MALASSRNMFCRRLVSYGLRRKDVIHNSFCNVISLRSVSSSDELSTTTLLLQNGVNIHEVPLIIRKVCGTNTSSLLFGDRSCDNNEASDNQQKNGNSDRIPEEEELEEILKGFQNCNSYGEISKLLEIVPSSYVNPSIAFHVLKRMSEVDSSNYSKSSVSEDISNNFTKTAVFNQLIGIILASNDSSVILNCLVLFNRNAVFKKYTESYLNKLIEKILLNMSENKYDIEKIITIVHEFDRAGKWKEIDNLWIGINANFSNINAKNVVKLFLTLPYFNESRAIVASTLHKKVKSVWWNLLGSDIVDILVISKETRTSTALLLQILAKLLNTQIHSISEDELLLIINGFKALDYTNSQIINALERYVKFKGMNMNEHLFAGIMDYLLKFRIRSSVILGKCCDYFIQHGRTLSPFVIKSLFIPFGVLDYHPTRSHEFWKTFEEIFQDNFTRFSPDHSLDMLLSCVYLEKFPINLMNHVFNPFFLNKLQLTSDNWNKTIANLKLLDQTMTLECNSYIGPVLFRSLKVNYFESEKRIKFLLYMLERHFLNVIGSYWQIYFHKIARNMPLISHYLIDMLIIPESDESPEQPLAVLIHIPDHYTLHENHLIGSQIMKKRQLEKLGYKVICLNYIELCEMKNSPKKIERFIKNLLSDHL